MTRLFDPLRLGDIALANRVVMAPLTRDRAGPGQVPGDLAVTYYAQRATAGLIITEGTPVRPDGHGYLDTPGLHDDAQQAGWKKVTDAVHARGGKIVVQLWHVGRISHTSLLPAGEVPVSSSALLAQAKTFTQQGFESVSAPRALRTDEIPGVVQAFAQAARRAIDAGFDGVEIHGANGYLIEQFLRDSLNQRQDAYGGPIDNRIRLLVEILQAVTAEIGSSRTGLRLSPVTPSNDAGLDSDPQALFNAVVDALVPLNLAFLEVVEGATGGPRDVAPFDFAELRRRFNGPYIANNGYNRELAFDAVDSGQVDAVSFGKAFISNPDLVRRLRENAPLNEVDRDTLYGGGAKGYTDYPALDEQPA